MERKKIPFSQDFYITVNGEVYDSLGVKRKTYKNGDGYITVSIKLQDRRWVTFGVHRLVALTYLTEKLPEQISVNHRDSDIENNHVSNLEWVTDLQNNIHSEIMRRDGNVVKVYSVKNGVAINGYFNAHHASEDVGCTALEVWDSIKNGTSVGELQFRYISNTDRIPDGLRKDRRVLLSKKLQPKGVKSLDIDTGEMLEFNSLHEAAKYFNTSPSHIYLSISKNQFPKVFRKQYQITYIDQDFPQMTIEEFRRAKESGKKKVFAYNLDSNSLLFCDSASDFIRATGLSKKAVTVSLKNNKIRVVGSWVFLYLNEDNQKLMKSYISGLAEV